MDFRLALQSAYRLRPCQVLPNALWKTLAQIDVWETRAAARPDIDEVFHLEAWAANRLMLYWNLDRRLEIPMDRLEKLDFALLHQDYLPFIQTAHFTHRDAYFRLSIQPGSAAKASLPAGFSLRPAVPDLQAVEISAFISRCYEDLHPGPETVKTWGRHPVFAPDLWVWVWDERRSCPAGLGIAERDAVVGEGSLEWIQLLPEYRGIGLGRALVCELLNRLEGRASVITVSGAVDNRTRPERLYRACGFSGDDIWYVLRA